MVGVAATSCLEVIKRHVGTLSLNQERNECWCSTTPTGDEEWPVWQLVLPVPKIALSSDYAKRTSVTQLRKEVKIQKGANLVRLG